MAAKGTRGTKHFVSLVPFFVTLCFFAGPAFGQTVWDGVCTGDQATRGQAAHTQNCFACHKADLLGIEGAMKGEPFMELRREDSLETLFLDMKAAMPRTHSPMLRISIRCRTSIRRSRSSNQREFY